MTWANTAWGLVCAQLHAALLPEYPGLALGIGPDDWTRHEGQAEALFLGPGQSARRGTLDTRVDAERIEAPIRGAAPPGRRALFDRICPIVLHLTQPYPTAEGAADDSPERCEDLFERFLDALNTIAHIRASEIESVTWFGGSIGINGTACEVVFALRFTVYSKPLRQVQPESSAIEAVQVADPALAVVDEVVPGD